MGITSYFYEVRGGYHEGERAFRRAANVLRRLCEAGSADGAALQVALCDMLTNQAYFTLRRGKSADAQATLRQCIEQLRALGDAHITAYHLINLAQVLVALGRHAEAREMAQESLSLTKDTGDRYGIGNALCCLGLVAHAMFERGLAFFQEIGDALNASRVYIHLGHMKLASGDVGAAQGLFSAAVGIAADAHIPVLDALTGLALLRAQMGQGAAALELVIHVLQHPSSGTEAKDNARRLQAELEAQLVPEQIEAVRARAQQKTFEGIRDEVLEQVAVDWFPCSQ